MTNQNLGYTDEKLYEAIKQAIEDIFDITKQQLDEGAIEKETTETHVPVGELDSLADKQDFDGIVRQEEVVDYKETIKNASTEDLESLNRASNLLDSNEIYDVDGLNFVPPRREIRDSSEWTVASKTEIFEYDIKRLSWRAAIKSGAFEIGEDFPSLYFQYIRSLIPKPFGYNVYCPILNMLGGFGEITLPTEFSFQKRENKYEILSSQIKPVTAEFLCGLFNKGYSAKFPRINHDYKQKWTHYLKLEIFGIPANLPRQYIKSVGRGLRLFGPEQPIVFMGPAYDTSHWVPTDSFGVPSIGGIMPPELKVDTVYERASYGLQPQSSRSLSLSEAKGAKSFLSVYLNYLNPELEDEITSTLRRYDNMFSNIYVEDIIVDCAIGFEGSLLRDLGHSSSSATYRLKYRGGALLQHRDIQRNRVQNFFDSLYKIRGEIVHQDRNINDLLSDVEFEFPPQMKDDTERALWYARFARKILSYTIQEYIRMKMEYNMGVTQTNQFLDKMALEIRYDEEELE